jgi:hypothetical protein
MQSAVRVVPNIGSTPTPSSGAAFDYANPSANLNGNGSTETNSYQVGVYGA